MAFGFGAELIERHWRIETQLAVIITIKFFLFNGINRFGFILFAQVGKLNHVEVNPIINTFLHTSVQIVQILDERTLGESNRKCVHGMMAMVVALGPILYATDTLSVTTFNYFCHAQLVVLIPIEFLHNINKLPVIAQTVGYGTSCRHDKTHQLFQNLASFLSNVLRVAQISVDKATWYVSLFHQKFVALSLGNLTIFIQILNTRLILTVGKLVAIFCGHKIESCCIRFVQIGLTGFQGLI